MNWNPSHVDVKHLQSNDPVKILKHTFEGAEKAGVTIILQSDYLRETDKKSILTQIALFKRQFESSTPNADGLKKWNSHLSSSEPQQQQQQQNSDTQKRVS